MVGIEESENGFTIGAGPFRLAFTWDGVRWSHALTFEGRLLASSLEMEPERDDPARLISPAYQQFSHQEGGGGVQALLVGQWGPHHCSGVFTCEFQNPGISIAVDVAVRTRGVIEALAATYLVQRTSSDLRDANPLLMVWELEGHKPSRLRFEARAPAGVCLAEGGRQATRIQASGRIEPDSSTQRLYYCWQWFPC